MKLLTQTFAKQISFTLGCYDRIIITGTIPEICHCKGMTNFMMRHKIRIFDLLFIKENNRITNSQYQEYSMCQSVQLLMTSNFGKTKPDVPKLAQLERQNYILERSNKGAIHTV